MKITTDNLEIAVNNCHDDVSYWQDKLDNEKRFTRRNYFRSKLEIAKGLLKQAKEALENSKTVRP